MSQKRTRNSTSECRLLSLTRQSPVGTYRFEADGQSTITVQTQGTEDGLVLVDAIRFVPAWKETDTGLAEKAKAEKPVKGSAQTSENKPWIKGFFEKNPSADTNEDGILTLEEANRFKE